MASEQAALKSEDLSCDDWLLLAIRSLESLGSSIDLGNVQLVSRRLAQSVGRCTKNWVSGMTLPVVSSVVTTLDAGMSKGPPFCLLIWQSCSLTHREKVSQKRRNAELCHFRCQYSCPSNKADSMVDGKSSHFGLQRASRSKQWNQRPSATLHNMKSVLKFYSSRIDFIKF